MSSSAAAPFDPQFTRGEFLPPWELAKAYAFHVVLETAQSGTDMPCVVLVGLNMNDFIASQVTNAQGEHPSERAIRGAVARCKEPGWYPGKPRDNKGGRQPAFSDFQKRRAAEVAMDLKRKRVAPTPRRVRGRLSKLLENPETGAPMSDRSFQRIFATKCYDKTEDDPWQYFDSPSQDVCQSL